MKHISKGYTLLESLVVLGIVAGLFLIGSRMPVSTPNMSQWSATFKSSWQQERISAQTQQCRQTVHFRENDIVFNHTQLAYPKGIITTRHRQSKFYQQVMLPRRQ